MSTQDIIERLERASGPDREIDLLIFTVIGAPLPEKFANRNYKLEWSDEELCFVAPVGDLRIRYEQPAFTASIDAALTLVPEGWWTEVFARKDQPSCRLYEFHGSCRKVPGGKATVFGLPVIVGANPAIAICIAALLARASISSKEQVGS